MCIINSYTMGRSLFLTFTQGMLCLVPCLYLLLNGQHVLIINPWILVAFLFCANILFSVFFWKQLGWSNRGRQTQALFLLATAFVPLFTYQWIQPANNMSYSLAIQTVLYCTGQITWLIAVEITPDWVGRIRQRRAEERALSGKQKFHAREEVVKEHAKERASKR